jgi:hypothetical protein
MTEKELAERKRMHLCYHFVDYGGCCPIAHDPRLPDRECTCPQQWKEAVGRKK